VRLAVDASALVAETLRTRGRDLLEDPLLELVITREAREESECEITRRQVLIAAKWGLTPAEALVLLEESLDLVRRNVAVAANSVSERRSMEARQRMARDLDDAPTLALALALDCGIWTADHDFFGCGVPAWSTETLLWYVQSQTG
jgi:hypothetical protein